MILKKFAAGKIAQRTCQYNLLHEIRHLDMTQNKQKKPFFCRQRNSEKCAGDVTQTKIFIF